MSQVNAGMFRAFVAPRKPRTRHLVMPGAAFPRSLCHEEHWDVKRADDDGPATLCQECATLAQFLLDATVDALRALR